MRLHGVEVEGYRSIRQSMSLPVDRHVTVVLGANDHGKSNLIEALLHLNADAPFDEERDLNWDCTDRRDALPPVSFLFELDVAPT